MRELVVSRNTSLGDAGVSLVASMLTGAGAAATLTHLDISNTGCGDVGLTAIASAIGKRPTGTFSAGSGGSAVMLSELLLCGNAGVSGVKAWTALAAALPALPCLTHLDLDSCSGLGDDGLRPIASALPWCTGLKTLSLNRCAVGDDGATALAVSSSRLPLLVIPRHSLTDCVWLQRGITAAEGLQLQSLDAAWNVIGGQAVGLVLRAVADVPLPLQQERPQLKFERAPGGFQTAKFAPAAVGVAVELLPDSKKRGPC